MWFPRLTLLLGFLILSGCAGVGPPPQEDFAENWRDRQAPGFRLDRLDGTELALESYRGEKVVVLNFFGTWCPPCRAELPALDQLYHTHDDEMVLVGVAQNEEASAVRRFMRELDVDFPVVMDPAGEASVASRYDVPTLPTTVVVGRSGTVLYYRPGMLQHYDFDYLENLVEDPEPHSS